MRRAIHVLLLPLLAAGACSGDSTLVPDLARNRIVETGIDVTLDRGSYRAGERLVVTLSNHTPRSYGYNLCSRSYERRIGDDWSAMPPELRLCTADLRGLPSGEVRTGETDLPADFPAGTYRLLVYFVDATPGGHTSVVAFSAPFAVQ